MAGVGRLQAAVASATQETTLALANINFDFSLLKVEAPAEYKPLGQALSATRRITAEHGTSHITARKLTCLFDSILPSTPKLIHAYGLRVSDIAQHPAVNPSSDRSYGPFSAHVGVDGTNIWAAATSGSGAIAMHLLACMLARVWTPSEAVAIWEQIVEERKNELTIWDENDTLPLSDLTAGQITLSREQLADWDASARAWLRAADVARELNQKQLLLIVKNLNIPIDENMNVYSSVIEAWKTAMRTMDKLIDGVSHSVNSGAVLLGLSAWHIYPDLIILGSKIAHTKQNDPLVAPNGNVTIGLHGVEAADSQGVYWSLSLAHLRFYGDPVPSQRSVDTDLSRISFDDLWHVILGSLFATWGIVGEKAMEEAAKIICLLWIKFKESTDLHLANVFLEKDGHFWLRYLAITAERWINSTDTERQSHNRLLQLGQRRGALLGRMEKPVPMFNLTNGKFVAILEMEAKVKYLRRVASHWSNETDMLLIVIRLCDSKFSPNRFSEGTAVQFASAGT